MKKTARQIQDGIFKRMSAEKKIKMASSFWNFAKTIAGVDRIYYNIDGTAEYIKKNR